MYLSSPPYYIYKHYIKHIALQFELDTSIEKWFVRPLRTRSMLGTYKEFISYGLIEFIPDLLSNLIEKIMSFPHF